MAHQDAVQVIVNPVYVVITLGIKRYKVTAPLSATHDPLLMYVVENVTGVGVVTTRSFE